MTTPVERMEAIMASLVQECSRMNTRNDTSNKLNANLGFVQKREDTKNPKSKLEAGIGTSATTDNKQVANGEVGSSMTTNATDNTTLKKRKKKKKKKNNNPDLGGILSTHDSTQEGLSTTKVLEVTKMISVSAKTATPDANTESKGDLLEGASGKMEESKTTNNGNDASKLTKSQKRNRIKALNKILYANIGSSEKGEDTGISSTGTGDGKSSNSKEKEHTKVGNGEMGSSLTANLIVEVEVQKKMEAVIGEMSSGINAVDNATLNARKINIRKMKNNNPDLGDILSTRESTEGLSTTKVLEVKSGEMISAKTATPDANIVSKGDALEVASGKMVESETTNNGNGAPGLTKSQKRNRLKARKKKLNAKLGSSGKGEDTDISSAGTSDGTRSSSKVNEHTKVANGEMGSSLTTNLIGEVEVQKKMEANPDCAILSTRESTEEGLSTTKVLEVTSGDMISAKTATSDANTISKGDHLEVASGKMEESETTNNGNVAPELTKSQKRNRLKARKKMLNANLGSSEKGEDSSISSAGTVDGKSSSFKEKEHTKVAIGEIGSSLTTSLNGEVDVQKKMEAIIGETSLGITAAANTTLKKRKRIMNDNPDLGGILSSRKSTEEGLSTTEVLEVKSCEMISAKTAIPEENMVSIGYHSEVASGKMKESEATNNGNETTNKALENKLNANLGSLEKREDNENPKGKPEIQFCTISQASIQDNPNTGISSADTGDGKSSNFNVKEHTEVANGEMGSSLTANLNREVEVQKAMGTTIGNTSSGTNATDNTVSKKRKRNRKKMNNNPDLGDILSTRESTQEGLGMNKVLEVTCNETVSSKTTIPDANMLSKEVVANMKTGESETTNVNVNGKEKSKKKPDSENKRPTLAKIFNPQYSQSLEASKCEASSGTTSTDKPASKKQKTQKLNKRPTLAEILNPQYSQSLEASNCEAGSGTTSTDKPTSKKQKMQKLNKRPTLAEILNPRYSQSLEASKCETGSGTTSTDKPASKKQKTQKLNTNPDLGITLSTHERTQEGSGTTKDPELKKDDSI